MLLALRRKDRYVLCFLASFLQCPAFPPTNSISSLGPSHLKAPIGTGPCPLPTTCGPYSSGMATLGFPVRQLGGFSINSGVPGKPFLFIRTRSSSDFYPFGKLSQTHLRKLDLSPPCCHLYLTQSPALTPLHGEGLFISWSHTL